MTMALAQQARLCLARALESLQVIDAPVQLLHVAAPVARAMGSVVGLETAQHTPAPEEVDPARTALRDALRLLQVPELVEAPPALRALAAVAEALANLIELKRQLRAHAGGAASVQPSREPSAAPAPAQEQAAREQAAREQAAREHAAREHAAREAARAAREQAERERVAREQAARDDAARELAAQEQAAREQAARQRAQREQADREHAAREQAARDEAERAQMERDEAARELAAQQAQRDEAAHQMVRDRELLEQAARDAEAREQALREQAEWERAAREEAARGHILRESARAAPIEAQPVVSASATPEAPPPQSVPPGPASSRSAPRRNVVAELDLRAVEAALGTHSASNFYNGLSGDDVVTSGGLFVATYQVPEVGEKVLLKISMPGGYEFVAKGVVAWTRVPREVMTGTESVPAPAAPPGFGAQISEVSDEGRRLIQRYVRNREPLFHDT